MRSIFGAVILVIGSWMLADAAKTAGNYTSISTDGGCRLYIGNIRFTRQDAQKGAPKVAYLDGQTSLYNDTVDPDVPCGNYSGNIVLNFTKVTYYNSEETALDSIIINFDIEYQKKYRWWKLRSLSLTAHGDMITTDSKQLEANWTGAVVDSADIGASYKFGYACSKTTAFSYSDDKKTQPSYTIQFLNFHLQPFEYVKKGNKDGFTDNVDDCVAFFSASVWMALLTLALFVLIILSGIVMLSNMTTVNRFDDPKAKQLVIAAKD
jgi:V-type H+-transporting ATPase S1 subunit